MPDEQKELVVQRLWESFDWLNSHYAPLAVAEFDSPAGRIRFEVWRTRNGAAHMRVRQEDGPWIRGGGKVYSIKPRGKYHAPHAPDITREGVFKHFMGTRYDSLMTQIRKELS